MSRAAAVLRAALLAAALLGIIVALFLTHMRQEERFFAAPATDEEAAGVVRSAFQDALKRSPTQAELAKYTPDVRSGKYDRDALVKLLKDTEPCSDVTMDRAITTAFQKTLSRPPTETEMKRYRQQLMGLAADNDDRCFLLASRLMGQYLDLALTNPSPEIVRQEQKQEKPAATPVVPVLMMTPTESNADKASRAAEPQAKKALMAPLEQHGASVTAQATAPAAAQVSLTAQQAYAMYQDIFGRPATPAMLEVIDLKMRGNAGMGASEMRAFLLSLKDAAVPAQKVVAAPRAPADPFYEGLGAVQQTPAESGMEPALQMDVLRGLVCEGVLDKDEPHRETLLSSLVSERDRANLVNLCQRSKTVSVPLEMGLNQAARAPVPPEDGTKWIQDSDLVGTPLEQAQTTSVGSIMPRFVYTEYV